MPKILFALLVFDCVSFFFFGVSCLLSPFMKVEFTRYGLTKYRTMTGILQLLGASALLVGFWLPGFSFLGCAGLGLLMLCGFVVRLKIRDSFVQSFPAFFYCVLNVVLAFLVLRVG